MFILDTNAVSELRSVRVGRAHPCVAESVQTTKLYVSVITIEELAIATGLVHGMAVITHNVADFKSTGIADRQRVARREIETSVEAFPAKASCSQCWRADV